MDTINVASICKALGDSNRLEIMKVLSEGEKCGCKLLEKFGITQSTLSHHMKVLTGCGLVNDSRIFPIFEVAAEHVAVRTPGACFCTAVNQVPGDSLRRSVIDFGQRSIFFIRWGK